MRFHITGTLRGFDQFMNFQCVSSADSPPLPLSRGTRLYIQDKYIQDKDKKSVQRAGFLGGSCLLGQLKKKSGKKASPALAPGPGPLFQILIQRY